MALVPKVAITRHPRALPDQPYTIPPAIARRNTPMNPTTVICYNCNKNGYFALSCPELKIISDIKEIEEGETSNELGKEKP